MARRCRPGLLGGFTPQLFAETRQGQQRFWEFFGAHIRTANTRLAYVTAAYRFADWCEAQALTLAQVEPFMEHDDHDLMEAHLWPADYGRGQ